MAWKNVPIRVVYTNRMVRTYESCAALADELGITERTVQGWVQKKSKGHLKFDIVSVTMLM